MNKNFIKTASAVVLIMLNLKIHAITPRDNWYGGVFLGPSVTQTNTFNFGKPVTFSNSNVTVSATSGQITQSVMGDVGLQFGRRFCTKHRIEAEIFYNNNPFKELKLYNYSMTNTYYPPANESVYLKIFKNLDNSSDAHIQGETNTGALMLNFIYDLFTTSANSDGYNKVVPFVGAGIGYAYVQNALQLYRATTTDPALDPYKNREIVSVLQKRYIYAGQALAGLNYFMDDFTWFGIDVRYFTTGSSIVNSQYTYITPTTVFVTSSNSSLFNNKTQIISANLSFNGTFNF